MPTSIKESLKSNSIQATRAGSNRIQKQKVHHFNLCNRYKSAVCEPEVYLPPQNHHKISRSLPSKRQKQSFPDVTFDQKTIKKIRHIRKKMFSTPRKLSEIFNFSPELRSTHIEYNQLIWAKDRWTLFLVLCVSWGIKHVRKSYHFTFRVTWARVLFIYSMSVLFSHRLESKILKTFLVRSGPLSQVEMSRVFGLRVPIPCHANFQSRSPRSFTRLKK